MIYLLEDLNSSPVAGGQAGGSGVESADQKLLRLLPLLSEERRKKARSYCFAVDRLASATVYALLRYALFQEYGITSVPEFIYNSTGKPAFKDRPGIHFNFSHCQRAAACIVGGAEVGIDVQEHFVFKTGIMEQICSGNEKALLVGSKVKERLLNRLWVIKEAYTKYLGIGLTADLQKLDFSRELYKDAFRIPGTLYNSAECFLRLVEREQYLLAVCSDREESGMVCLNMEELVASLDSISGRLDQA